MLELLRCGLLTILLFSNLGYGDSQADTNGTKLSSATETAKAVPTTVSSNSTLSAITPTFGNGTCPSRTANYITHTLPQQCLRTDRVTATSSASSSGDAHTGSTEGLLDPVASTEAASPSADRVSEFSSIGTDTTIAESTPASVSTSTSATSSEQVEESDSPLDNANFLSFEEWKKQNLAKLEPEQGRNAALDNDRPRPGINNALETLGDEGEIDLDFSGFGQTPNGPSQPRAAYRQPDGSTPSDVPTSQNVRSKDAGKTCKERTNYASFDCAAQVLKHNPEVKSPYSVLVENKDSYMLNTCSVKNKFFIVELCNDILIDTIVLANYEFFSSIFRHFRVSVSDRYPVKMDKWRELGVFEAKNTREIQAFLVENPQIWARYLRIEILSHYGSEYYCPVSLLRVHGINMLEDIRPHDEIAPGESSTDETIPELESEASSIISQESPAATLEVSKGALIQHDALESVVIPSDVTTSQSVLEGQSNEPIASIMSSSSEDSSRNASMAVPTIPGPELSTMTCSTNSSIVVSESSGWQTNSSTSGTQMTSGASPARSDQAVVASKSDVVAHNNTSTSTPTSAINSVDASKIPRSEVSTNVTVGQSESKTSSTSQSGIPASESAVASMSQSTTSTNSTRTTSATPSSSIAPPQPSTQESFFKSLSKRLQQLESNSTLSLQYIEEQSRILRDAFSKVEKRQISSTTNFLSNLNETVIKELQGFRQAYDQLWQSTVLELEGQREQYQREMLVLSSRLTLVADELVWQKRMGIVQSGLLLLCLGLVLFARTGLHGYLEVPLVQQMMNKSSTALSRAGWESPPASPSPENRSPVAVFRRKLWRSVTEPERVASGHATDGDVTGTDSRPDTRDGPGVDVFVEPPTPPQCRGTDSSVSVVYDDADADADADDEDEDVVDPRESQSGPSTPTGTRDVGSMDRGSDMANGVLEHGVG